MGSDGNKMNDGTSFQPSDPTLCANGCGFFGLAATMNLCSKCYRDEQIKEELAASATAAMGKIVDGYAAKSRTDVEASSPLTPASIKSAPEPPIAGSSDGGAAAPAPRASNRCLCCNKKVGVMGFKCRCGSTFCGTHRYPEKHECEFDFKSKGKEAIAKANPVVKADKIDRF